MNRPFSLEITYMTSSKNIEVKQIDVISPTGGFLIGPGSAPLVSVLGKNTKMILTLTTDALTDLTIPAGVLRINEKHDVFILIIDPEIIDW
jgi:hypothetical protein